MKKREDLKIIHLQFRVAEEMRDHEWKSFVDHMKLKPHQIVRHYILENELDLQTLKNYDGIIVAGTGDFEVKHIKEKFPRAYKQMKKIAKLNKQLKIPVMNVCLQIWNALHGGKIGKMAEAETGVFTIKLTDEAKNDPLFRDLPKEFKALLGHKDYVSKLPKGAVLLAYSKMCPVEVFRLNENEYFFQFHPELNRRSYIERIDFYAKRYAPKDPEEFNRLKKSLIDTKEPEMLLERFIDKIVLK